jgi:hypothetical protein
MVVWGDAPCVRRVWLVLDGQQLDLHDEQGGYFITEFDPGAPTVRDVTNNRPDANGLDDHTQFLGGRVVTVSLTAIRSAGAQVDAVASSFAPFMVPSARPVLHYVLDRPGAPERIMNVRAAQYAYKVNDPEQRDVQLQFVAADPLAYDPAVQSGVAFAGSAGNVAGRSYDLTFDRTYPAGSTSPSDALLVPAGDVPVAPLLRLYGPATGAAVRFTVGGANAGAVGLVASYVIAAGHYVEVDTDERTAYLDGDRTKNVLTSLNWNLIISSGWPRLAPGVTTEMAYTGTSTTTSSQAVAFWNDGYLS